MVLAKKRSSKKDKTGTDDKSAETEQHFESSTEELELYRGVMARVGAMTAEIELAKKDLELADEAKVEAEAAYDAAKNRVTEARSRVQGAERTLLRFMNPTDGEWHPLFDSMEPADEEKHGKGSDKWRQDPISALKLSLAAAQALIDAEILFVGQLQDRVIRDGNTWWTHVYGLSLAVAAAITDKLNDFILERTA